MNLRQLSWAWRVVIAGAVVASLAGCGSAKPIARPPVVASSVEETEPRPSKPVDELEALLRSDEELASVLNDAARRRVQVLVTIPEEGGVLRRLGHRVDAEYFYPASSVKLCAAFGVLDKLADVRKGPSRPRVGLTTKVRFIDGIGRSRHIHMTTLETELERSLVLSDNEAHNRLFDFVGDAELASRLANAGLMSPRIAHRLGRKDPDHTPPPAIEMRAPNSRSPIVIAQRADYELPPPPKEILIGTSHVDESGSVVSGPMDFANKNIISLRDLHYLLIAITRPDLADRGKPLLTNDDDRRRLVRIMGMLPSELPPKIRRAVRGPDASYKRMHAAMTSALPRDKVRVHEKGGRAYGFAVENAYAVNETTGRSLFVTATIYANDNETLNDDRYDYETLANPFMMRLGNVLAQRFLTQPEGTN